MATFRVGQRVRLVKNMNPCPPVLPIGTEGKIIPHNGKLSRGADGTIYQTEYCVVWDGDDGRIRGADGWQLEPIQPERNQTIPWSECLWQPNQQEETA